jgi:hypothetical protein
MLWFLSHDELKVVDRLFPRYIESSIPDAYWYLHGLQYNVNGLDQTTEEEVVFCRYLKRRYGNCMGTGRT